jgi:Transcription termination factor
VSGLVDLADGHAFVRTSGYRRGPDDIYVSAAQIRQYGLRKGDLIEGTARPAAQRHGARQVPAAARSGHGQRSRPACPARTSTT